MTKSELVPKRWTKPEFTKLGTLRDSAGYEAVTTNTRTGNFRNPS